MPRISVKDALLFSLRFSLTESENIWPRIILPVLSGGLALYGAFYIYLLKFETYLHNPSERVASLVLGLATAGLLLTLFMHSLTSSAIASLALGRPDKGWKYFCISRRAWRVYAAYLRFLFTCAVFVISIEILQRLMQGLVPSAWISPATRLVILCGLFVLFVRVGFLIAPVAAAADKGPVVRLSWRITGQGPSSLAIIMTAVVLPGFLIEAVGELVIRTIGLAPLLQPSGRIIEFVAGYREALPGVLVAIGIAYSLVIVPLVAASVGAYRQIETKSR